MTDNAKTHKPPYVPFTTFRNFINGLVDNGLPSTIDKSLMPTLSGGMQSTLLISLKSTGLIEESGKPTPRLERYVRGDDAQRQEVMVEVLREGFPYLFREGVDLKRMTPAQFDKLIRDETDVSSSTLDKVASFFLAAAKELGIEISSHLTKRKNAFKRSPKAKSEERSDNGDENGKEKARQKDEGNGEGCGSNHDKSRSNKAMEYELVDLMKDPEVGDVERNAIWTLIQFLTRNKQKAADQGSTAS